MKLNNPRLFTEKIQWLKLYNRKELYRILVDKIEVKDYVSSIIGQEYIIPTLCVLEDITELDLLKLPDKFVLKTNNGGGSNGVVLCKNKENFDKERAIRKLKKSLQYDIYSKSREWPYKDMKKKVFVEAFMEDRQNEDLIDYKFFCFNGYWIHITIYIFI